MDKRIILRFSIIPIVLLLALSAMLYWRLIWLEKSERMIAEQAKAIIEVQTILASAGQLKALDADMKNRLDDIKDDLYALDQAVDLVKSISYIAEHNQVLLNDFKFDLEKYIDQKDLAGEIGPFIVPFECVVQGEYSKIGKFIYATEKRKFIGDIANLKFYCDSSGRTNVVCEIRGSLRFFDIKLLKDTQDEES